MSKKITPTPIPGQRISCSGCRANMLDQASHMEKGGCLGWDEWDECITEFILIDDIMEDINARLGVDILRQTPKKRMINLNNRLKEEHAKGVTTINFPRKKSN